MSEFTDVMEQARRMCEAHGGMCNHRNCPLDNGEACRLAADQDGEDYNEVERIIMDWGKGTAGTLEVYRARRDCYELAGGDA